MSGNAVISEDDIPLGRNKASSCPSTSRETGNDSVHTGTSTDPQQFVQLAVTHVYEPVLDTSKLRFQLAVARAQVSESERELQQIEEPDAPDTFSQLQEAEREIAQLEARRTAHECTLRKVNEAVDALTDNGYELGDELQAQRDKLQQCLKDYYSALDDAKTRRETRMC